MLADAKQVKNLPGRPKRDPADSRWLAACFERGAVTACFVATPEFRLIRLHTRSRYSGSSVTSSTRPSPLLSLHLLACEVVPPGEPGGERRNLTRVLEATMNGP